MAQAVTEVDRKLTASMEAFANDSERVRVLQQGKTFRGRVSQPRSRAPVQLAGPAWSHPKKA